MAGRKARYIWAAIVLLFLGICGIWGAASLLSRSTNSQVAPATLPATDVTFAATDGSQITGTYRPGHRANSPAILLLHGNGASRAAMDANAAWLSDQGFATLAIDFRGHGESAVADHSFGWFEARDAHAALDWLKRRQSGARVGVIGVSLGGAAALIGEHGPVPADAFVLQAVYPDIRRAIHNRLSMRLGSILATVIEPLFSYQALLRQGVSPDALSPIHAVSAVRAPVLVIGGGEDGRTPPVETRAMFAAARHAPARSLWIIPGQDHDAVTTEESAAYRARISAFFTQILGAPGGAE